MASPFRSDALASRVALVTGGSSGIGLEISRQLARHGARVVLCGRRASVVADSVAVLRGEGLDAAGSSADVRSPEQMDALLASVRATHGALHVLVNCAAGNFLALPEGTLARAGEHSARLALPPSALSAGRWSAAGLPPRDEPPAASAPPDGGRAPAWWSPAGLPRSLPPLCAQTCPPTGSRL